VPQNAPGIVVFAHGSGSSRHSPRNRHVADLLTGAGHLFEEPGTLDAAAGLAREWLTSHLTLGPA
jgi:hypothetical protein